MIFGIYVEKNVELPERNPKRKQGRFVIQGNRVRDEENMMALFQVLGPAPASVASSKMLDLIARLPGCRGVQTDAVRAHTQALMSGIETWIWLPNWPPGWKGMRDPAAPLCLALYGHPDSGTFWEQHCEERSLMKGFHSIPGWPDVLPMILFMSCWRSTSTISSLRVSNRTSNQLGKRFPMQ